MRSSPLCKLSGAPRLPPPIDKDLLQFEEAKRVVELDRNLIVIAVLIVALPIIAALAAMIAVLAVGNR
jgi:hypothetical protein